MIISFTTRRSDDIHLPKVNLEVGKKSCYFTGAMELNGLPRHNKSKESFIKFQGTFDTFSLIRRG